MNLFYFFEESNSCHKTILIWFEQMDRLLKWECSNRDRLVFLDFMLSNKFSSIKFKAPITYLIAYDFGDHFTTFSHRRLLTNQGKFLNNHREV